MSELVGRINRHSHDPANGEAPVKWTTIEDRPTPGEVVRTHTVEFTAADIIFRGTHYLFPLPGVARFNRGYGHATLTLDGRKMTLGTEWLEFERPVKARRDATSAYWTQCIEIPGGPVAGTFRLTWIEHDVLDCLHGIREARLDDSNMLLWDGKTWLPLGPGNVNRFCNGVAWDPLPAGYKVEIWRKTPHKHSGLSMDPMFTRLNRKSGVRWMLYHVVDSTVDGINLDFLRRTWATPPRGSIGTEAFRFAFLRPDGARSMLSLETAIYHCREKWGPGHAVPHGRVRVK